MDEATTTIELLPTLLWFVLVVCLKCRQLNNRLWLELVTVVVLVFVSCFINSLLFSSYLLLLSTNHSRLEVRYRKSGRVVNALRWSVLSVCQSGGYQLLNGISLPPQFHSLACYWCLLLFCSWPTSWKERWRLWALEWVVAGTSKSRTLDKILCKHLRELMQSSFLGSCFAFCILTGFVAR